MVYSMLLRQWVDFGVFILQLKSTSSFPKKIAQFCVTDVSPRKRVFLCLNICKENVLQEKGI